MQVRHKMLEQLLQKSDALDEKLTMIEDDLNMQITHIKANFKSHKLQSKHEIDNIKNTLDDVKKKKKDLISQKFEEQNIKIRKLMQDKKKLSLENSELNSKINNLIEQE